MKSEVFHVKLMKSEVFFPLSCPLGSGCFLNQPVPPVRPSLVGTVLDCCMIQKTYHTSLETDPNYPFLEDFVIGFFWFLFLFLKIGPYLNWDEQQKILYTQPPSELLLNMLEPTLTSLCPTATTGRIKCIYECGLWVLESSDDLVCHDCNQCWNKAETRGVLTETQNPLELLICLSQR